MNQTAIRHIDTENELRACAALMQQLRPHLTDDADFVSRVNRMRTQNYHVLAAFHEGRAVALAGYRHQENLIYGRFIYVDDLVVDESERGAGWGAKLIEALDVLARDAGCAKLVLDTGLGNALAQRFYFRQGLLTSAIRFSKTLGASAA
ncbi:GNAT family N-acetyltransferase [Achromobacter seleniivolatilans]|uniref:GNAT family N-acetyltransferase n=1 Tax=Achromobacter seleniivolatilans TaxID=3047478 RepID=A0ABY9M9J3_9BURK|nr:GNAT family N-acetyltransferase [Achromobacter sp. R39]WMD23663.1 GNAT family N-acetyltransferase [Achromobacter sp. R39]